MTYESLVEKAQNSSPPLSHNWSRPRLLPRLPPRPRLPPPPRRRHPRLPHCCLFLRVTFAWLDSTCLQQDCLFLFPWSPLSCVRLSQRPFLLATCFWTSLSRVRLLQRHLLQPLSPLFWASLTCACLSQCLLHFFAFFCWGYFSPLPM